MLRAWTKKITYRTCGFDSFFCAQTNCLSATWLGSSIPTLTDSRTLLSTSWILSSCLDGLKVWAVLYPQDSMAQHGVPSARHTNFSAQHISVTLSYHGSQPWITRGSQIQCFGPVERLKSIKPTGHCSKRMLQLPQSHSPHFPDLGCSVWSIPWFYGHTHFILDNKGGSNFIKSYQFQESLDTNSREP